MRLRGGFFEPCPLTLALEQLRKAEEVQGIPLRMLPVRSRCYYR